VTSNKAKGSLFFRHWLALIAILTVFCPWGLAQTEEGTAAKPLEVVAVIPREFPPHYSLDEKGRPIGFAIDVMEQIAVLAGLRVSYLVKDTWVETNAALQDGTADIIPNTGITPQRQVDRAFTAPLETFSVSIFVRQSSLDIQGEDNLDGRKVAVVADNVALSLLQDRPDVEMTVFKHPENALFALLSGQVDALIYPQPVLLNIARSINVEDQIKVAGDPLIEIKRGIAVRKDNKELLAHLDAAVNLFLASDSYQKIYTKWHGQQASYWTAQRVGWGMGGLVLLVLLVMAAWRYLSIHRLNRKLVESMRDRSQALDSLRASEAHLRTLVETLPDLVWLKDPKGVYLSCNRKFEHFFNAKQSEILGKTDYDFFDKELAEFFRGKDKEAVDSGGPRMNEEEVTYRSDGHKEILETIKTPMLDSNGRLIGVLGIARDITDRKQAEMTLAESHRQLSALMSNLPGMAYRCLNDHQWTMEFLSEGCQALTGYPAAKCLGNRVISYNSLIHPDDRERVWNQVQSGLKKDRRFELEYRLITVHKAGDGPESNTVEAVL